MTSAFRRASGEAGAAPRAITPDMRRDCSTQGKFLRLFGAIWAGVGGLVGVIFALLSIAMPAMLLGAALGGAFAFVGTLLWILGRSQERLALSVFRDGVETEGEITDVYEDRMVRMNQQHPWRVAYTYLTKGGETAKGVATFWDNERPRATVGQRVVVLHDPSSGSRSVLWTRLRSGAAEEREVGAASFAVEEPRVRVAAPAEPVEIAGLETDVAQETAAEAAAEDALSQGGGREARNRDSLG